MNLPGPSPFAPCPKCAGTGRGHYRPHGERIPTWIATPCPECRPEASAVTKDGRVKTAEEKAEAAKARGRGL